MGRRSKADPFEKYYAGVFVVVVGGVLAWDLLPHWVVYSVAGVIVAAAAIGLVLRIRQGQTAPAVNRLHYAAPTPDLRLPPLSADDSADLKDAVGLRCENPHCQTRNVVEIHHIIPRHKQSSTNRLDNLIVLCNNCHVEADKGLYSQTQLRHWIRRPERFKYPELVECWDQRHSCP